MDAAAEIGKNPACKHQIHRECVWPMNGLTPDGTAEPLSGDTKFSRGANGESENF